MEEKERLKKLFFLLFLFVGLFILSLTVGIIQNNKSTAVPYPSQTERIYNATREEPGGTEPVSPAISVGTPTQTPQFYQWGDNIP